MKKAEMDKLREFAQKLTHTGGQGGGCLSPGLDLSEFLDTFEVEPEFTIPVEPEECDEGNCENCMFQKRLTGIPCNRIVMPFDKMTEE